MKTERETKCVAIGARTFLSAGLCGCDQEADKNVRAPWWGWRTRMSALQPLRMLQVATLFAGLAATALPAWAATSSADSNIITVDTRGTQSGTLTGLVQGNGTALANAQVRIDATPSTTNTDANGRFTLTTVPAGSGYLLKVSAAGFASKSVPGITVIAGTTDLGTITLGPTTGPYQIMPLAPDVNPATTTVEQGGTAYRYYLLQNSAGQPQGGVAVSVQVAGGSPIPQAQDVPSYWPGQVAGTSDADGIVRIAIPSSALGTPETIQTIQLSLSGQAQQTFQAQAVPRQ